MKTISAVIIGCIFVSGTCFANTDRIVTVKHNGVLEGIPSEYGPAILDVEFAQMNTNSVSITSISLKLGRNRVRIPKCLTGLIRTQQMSDIKASASWYHDEKILPYYLKVDFFNPGYNKSHWANPGFSLLFNLHSAKLMRIEKLIVLDNGRSTQYVQIEIASQCNSEERRNLGDDAR